MISVLTVVGEILSAIGVIVLAAAAPSTMVCEAGGGVITPAVSASTWHVAQGVANGSSSVLNIDGTDNTGSVGTDFFRSNTAVNLGSGGISGYTAVGEFAEGGIWPSGFSSSQRTSMCQNEQGYWGTATCSGSGGGGTQYYVSSSGSDSNNGTSTSTPWQTISHVNSEVGSIASGSTISFNGGNTFSGGLVLTQPVTINSYGSGQAEISSGNSTACVTATNVSNLTINNINCVGGGNTTNTTNGIAIYNTGSSQLSGPTITNVTGYGINGILLQQSNSGGSFTGTLVSSNVVHDVTGNYSGGSGSACIIFENPAFTHPLVVERHGRKQSRL